MLHYESEIKTILYREKILQLLLIIIDEFLICIAMDSLTITHNNTLMDRIDGKIRADSDKTDKKNVELGKIVKLNEELEKAYGKHMIFLPKITPTIDKIFLDFENFDKKYEKIVVPPPGVELEEYLVLLEELNIINKSLRALDAGID